MASEDELWQLVATRRQAVLATIKGDGLPQLSNVLYLSGPTGVPCASRPPPTGARRITWPATLVPFCT